MLFPFQQRALERLKELRPVVLHAPTGAGKTRAALEPFFLARGGGFRFPSQCVYSVPMRTLASQFFAEYYSAASRFDLPSMGVRIQTGEAPHDPELDGDLIFTTIDQTLSNWLCVPYSLGPSRANLNAGGVIGSYLVFDEFHLYPLGSIASAEGALVTSLQLLRTIRGLVPFVLMTATFSSPLLKEVCRLLNAELVVVSREELAQIPSQQGKQRRFDVVEDALAPRHVLAKHQDRSIAVCNTVQRASALYRGLIEAGCRPIPFDFGDLQELDAWLESEDGPNDNWILLLHARFEQEHRKLKEELVTREFGEERSKRRLGRMILVATQVIEVGLNITSQVLHTEVAPANAVIQRAGRCARFKDERGEVYVYRVSGNTAPYLDAEVKLCERAWHAFRNRAGQVVAFHEEQVIVDEVHADADRQLLETMARTEHRVWEQIVKAVCSQAIEYRPRLIRLVESRTLVIHDDPLQVGNPYLCNGFSIHHGSLRAWWRGAQSDAVAKRLPWNLLYPAANEPEGEARRKPEFQWHPVTCDADLDGHFVLAVHPRLIRYDAEIGFRFESSGGMYRTKSPSRDKGWGKYSYQLEEYAEHIARATTAYRSGISVRVRFAAGVLEARLGLKDGAIDRATRLVIALHDLGKLSREWQRWAHEYQKAIGEPVADHILIAHTHSENEQHRAAERRVRPMRPSHAAEGAVCSAVALQEGVERDEALFSATLMAIARNNTAGTKEFEPAELHGGARQTGSRALKAAGFEAAEAERLAEVLLMKTPATQLDHWILEPPNCPDAWSGWFAYLLIVRSLRLADARSLSDHWR